MAGSRCTVCDSPRREEINAELALQRQSLRNMAKQYGCSPWALLRHAARHLPETLAMSAEVERLAQSNRLADEVARLRAAMEAIAEEARADGKWGQAIAGLSASMSGLKLLSDSVLELERMRRETSHVGPIREHPGFRSFCQRVLGVLADFPEAQDAVVKRLTQNTGED